MGLIIISYDKKFDNYKVNIPKYQKDVNITTDYFVDAFKDSKIFYIIIITILLFFLFSLVYGGYSSKNNNSNFKGYEKWSYSIFNGIHIMLLITSIISLIFSILYFTGIKDLDDFMVIPVVIRQCFYFSINYYCICLSESEGSLQFFLNGKILVTLYITIWNFIYKFIKSSVKNEFILNIFQMSLSGFIILVFIYYLFFSKVFRYIICANCLNCNLCGCCQSCCSCCIYSIFCNEGTLYCDCCCCVNDQKCYNQSCVDNCYEWSCCKIPKKR